MDAQVIAAMAKWPNVPMMHGWLRLDRRGNWFLIDRGAPGFDEALHGKGSPITSPPIRDFIERNYSFDEQGQWFWQNGPQRVFVAFDLAPLVLRVMTTVKDPSITSLMTHCGDIVQTVKSASSDSEGNIYVLTEHGLGVVHDMDLAQLNIEGNEASEQLWLNWRGARLPIQHRNNSA
jgi:Protein of unknown function (DUF2946)